MRSKIRGFTVHEAVVSLAIIGLTAASGTGMAAWLAKQRVVTTANAMVADMHYARSEAVKRSVNVSLCKSDNGKKCTSHSDWQEGWIIFVDSETNRKRDKDEELLKVRQSLSSGFRIDLGVFGASKTTITYLPGGLANYSNGTFTFCYGDTSRAIIFNRIGRPRVSETQSDGSPLDCSR